MYPLGSRTCSARRARRCSPANEIAVFLVKQFQADWSQFHDRFSKKRVSRKVPKRMERAWPRMDQVVGGMSPPRLGPSVQEKDEMQLLLRALPSHSVGSDEEEDEEASAGPFSTSSEERAKAMTQLARRSAGTGTVKRRKLEIEKLHEVEQKLRARLAQLKAAADEQARLESRAESALSEAVQEAIMLQKKRAKWEAMLRQLSVRENNELRNSLLRQVRITKSLRRVLQRRMRQETMKSALALCTHRELMGSIARTIRIRTDPLFDRLTGGLDDLYSSVDTVFEKAGIHELPCPGRKNLSLKGASNKFVAFLDSVAVPFDVKATAKAVWDCLAELDWKGPKEFASRYFDPDRNALLTCWVESFSSGNITVPIKNCRVTRKYVEQARTVIVSQTFVDARSSPPVVFNATMRLIVSPDDTSELGPTSAIKSYREATRHNKSDLTRIITSENSVGAAAWDVEVTRFNHRVEDALVRKVNK